MPEMSDLYINICLRVTGKNLEAKKTNPVIDQYNNKLESCRIEEVRDDGKVFKAWVVDVSEFKHELLSKDVLICSRRVRFEVRSPYPHVDNHQNYVNAKVHKALMKIKVENWQAEREKILVETMSMHIPGNMREGRWPKEEPFDRAMI